MHAIFSYYIFFFFLFGFHSFEIFLGLEFSANTWTKKRQKMHHTLHGNLNDYYVVILILNYQNKRKTIMKEKVLNTILWNLPHFFLVRFNRLFHLHLLHQQFWWIISINIIFFRILARIKKMVSSSTSNVKCLWQKIFVNTICHVITTTHIVFRH